MLVDHIMLIAQINACMVKPISFKNIRFKTMLDILCTVHRLGENTTVNHSGDPSMTLVNTQALIY